GDRFVHEIAAHGSPSSPAPAGDPVITQPAGWYSWLQHDPEKACPGLDPGWTPLFGKDHAPTQMQPTRFCSRSAEVLTLAPARGYLRGISAKEAQAASFSFNAASDWPSRSNDSGALPDLACLVVTSRKISAASR